MSKTSKLEEDLDLTAGKSKIMMQGGRLKERDRKQTDRETLRVTVDKRERYEIHGQQRVPTLLGDIQPFKSFLCWRMVKVHVHML